MPRFTRITPRLPVAYVARTIGFYTTVLGFTVEVLWPDDKPAFCILDKDGVSVAFEGPGSPATSGESATTGGGFYIDVAGVAQLHDEIRGRVSVEWGPEVYFYGRREFAVRDPDGYLIILTEPTDDPVTCDGT